MKAKAARQAGERAGEAGRGEELSLCHDDCTRNGRGPAYYDVVVVRQRPKRLFLLEFNKTI